MNLAPLRDASSPFADFPHPSTMMLSSPHLPTLGAPLRAQLSSALTMRADAHALTPPTAIVG
jgi:hypothetical protein